MCVCESVSRGAGFCLIPGAGVDACSSPMLSSKVMALMLREQRMASLSTRLGSSRFLSLADTITHMSHRLMFTARRFARFSGEPWNGNAQSLTYHTG